MNQSASISVGKRVGDIAEACIREWTTKASETCSHVVFKAALMEGNRKEGVSKEMFEHIWATLSGMPCWDSDEVNAPWTSHVTYDVPPDMLEKSVTDLRRQSHCMRTTLECDAHGNDAEQVVTYLDVPPLRLGIATHAAIQVYLERRCSTRNYVKKEANFNKISVDVKKTLTFKEHYDWQYAFTLRYREPYHKTHDLMNNVEDKDMIFRDPPVCLFEISCAGIKDTHDHQYFTDSFLCKMTDVLPPTWRSIPLHVKVK